MNQLRPGAGRVGRCSGDRPGMVGDLAICRLHSVMGPSSDRRPSSGPKGHYRQLPTRTGSRFSAFPGAAASRPTD